MRLPRYITIVPWKIAIRVGRGVSYDTRCPSTAIVVTSRKNFFMSVLRSMATRAKRLPSGWPSPVEKRSAAPLIPHSASAFSISAQPG